MPRRLTDEEKEASRLRRNARARELRKQKKEEVKQLKTEVARCKFREETPAPPSALPAQTIASLRNIEEATKARNTARMIKKLPVMKPYSQFTMMTETIPHREDTLEPPIVREVKEEKKEKKDDNTFKNIYIDFLKNVLNGEDVIHENDVVKYDQDGEKYHKWESIKSYPIHSTSSGNEEYYLRKQNIIVELGWDKPTPSTEKIGQYKEQGETPIYVLIYSLDKKIGKMSSINALKETINILEQNSVSPPDVKGLVYGVKEEKKDDNTFKNIFLDFLKNVEKGEPAFHSNKELRFSDEKYHEWRSTKSYPIFTTEPHLHPFVEVEAPYDPSKPNTSGKSQYRIELGWDSPYLPPERVADKDILPLTDVRVLIVGFNDVIGNMPEKEALKETIRVLERTPVSLPERYSKDTFYGKNYTKEAIKSYFDERVKEEPEKKAPKLPVFKIVS